MPSELFSKRVLIIAGPNGAGKSTFAREFLPNEANCPTFINADLIAAGLSPFDPDKAAVHAGRLMLAEMDRHAAKGNDFAFETTLSGRMYARRIPQWQAAGYRVDLFYLRLASVDIAISRVKARSQQGGHHVREHVIRRRFHAGWVNFETIYKPIVNTWVVYDNSGAWSQIVDQVDNT